MKPLTLIVFFAFFLAKTPEPPTILMERRFRGTNELFEQFYVLKATPEIKHGYYMSFFALTAAQRQSIREGKTTMTDYIKVEGNYKNGKKSGKWFEYSQTNDTTKKFFFVDGQLQNNEYERKINLENQYASIKGIEIIDAKTGSAKSSSLVVGFKMEGIYPDYEVTHGIEGKVFLGYTLDSACNITQIRVVRSLSPGLDAVAIKGWRSCIESLKGTSFIQCNGRESNTAIRFSLGY